MFQIVECQPTFCPSTDARTGATYRVAEAGIMTAAWARHRAGVLKDRDFGECGDGFFYAIRAGEPLSRLSPVSFGPRDAAADEECPF